MKVEARKIDGFLVPAHEAIWDHGAAAICREGGFKTIEVAMRHVSAPKVAVEIGAHIGTWTVSLAERFEHVIAFEPDPSNFLLLTMNTGALHNVRRFPMAVGPAALRVEIRNEPDGNSFTGFCAEANGSLDKPWAPCIPLDCLNLPRLDLLKVDTEGAECFVFQGAQETIERCRPVVIFEENQCAVRYGGKRGDATDMIKGMGYREVASVEFHPGMHDVIVVPGEGQ